MLTAEGTAQLLLDPLVWMVAALLGVLLYRLSGARQRRLRRKRARLRQRADRAATPRERRELMLQWKELGGTRDIERAAERRSVREAGQKARGEGRPLSASPYLHSLWGPGRLWKQGWRSVDRSIRWIERNRARDG